MCEAKDFPPYERDELMGLVTQLQVQVAQLTAAKEELHKQLAELKRAGKRQAAPFSKGGRSSRPKRPGRKPGMGSFSYRLVEMLPVVAGFLAIIAIACGNAPLTSEAQTKYGFPPTPTPAYKLSSVQVTLDVARARWESKGSDDYTVEYKWLCLHPACGTPIKLTVKNGAVESATYLKYDGALHLIALPTG